MIDETVIVDGTEIESLIKLIIGWNKICIYYKFLQGFSFS